jgi:branched-chain amino acid transport system ATP-binding protein
MTEPVLQLRDMGKSFGGLEVCAGVNLQVVPGELHALIGPNGAGKTTLLNLISGRLPVDSGSLSFNGSDITNKSVHRRAQRGMARSFQITSLFMGFTVRENIELAVQAVQGSSYRFWQPAVRDSELRKPAREIMARVGLLERAEIRAENLAHGEQRLLEMGMALATRPSLLLLDEPMAGLGPGSSRNLAELIRGLKGNVTILLVEHDMNAVFSLADRITVLVQGRIIATDSPRKIRNNPVVQEAYLGTAC